MILKLFGPDYLPNRNAVHFFWSRGVVEKLLPRVAVSQEGLGISASVTRRQEWQHTGSHWLRIPEYHRVSLFELSSVTLPELTNTDPLPLGKHGVKFR